MKIQRLLSVLLVAVTTASCNDWLDMNPITQRSQNEMFSSESGFKDALIGCYIGMMEPSAYGGALTMNVVEHLAWSYSTTSGSVYQRLNLLDWDDAEVSATMEVIFLKLYNIIASCNSILDEIDDKKDVFVTQGLYELVKGEALALRAYCHFDLLRLWGPVPLLADDDAPTLPYVTRFSFNATPYSSYRDFYDSVLDDLTEAAGLLVDVDPVITKGYYASDFFGNRQFRMNYYAVKALMARVCMWEDDRPRALECALEVIEAVEAEAGSEALYTLGNNVRLTFNDLTFSTEHIFALYKFNLPSICDSYFNNGTFYRGNSYNEGILNELYENSATDIRAPNLGKWWKVVVSGMNNYVVTTKYTSTASPNNRVPLIRLAEMYLIAAEAHSDERYEEGLPYFNTYLTSRNVSLSNDSRPQLIANIKKQYRKEFYAEGVMWYVYKRFNSPRSDNFWAMNATYVPNYVAPLPATEPVQ